jgi:cytochrome c biogenesis protein CcmG/thiol:disulfide interchange protein DsbE
MKRGAVVLTLCAAIAYGAPAAPKGAVAGKPAPRFVLERPNGGEYTLESFAGRALVVNVFASWCPPCRHELPRLERAYERYKGRLAFLGVDEQEGAVTAAAFAKRMRVPYPIALDDGPFAAEYGAAAIPQTVFIDARGMVRAVWRGEISSEELERRLEKLATGKGA